MPQFLVELLPLQLLGQIVPVLPDTVDHLRLLPCGPAHITGVIHHHQGDGRRQGKQGIPPAADLSDGGRRGTDKSRVRAGHIAAPDHLPQIQVPVGHPMQQRFQHLGREPGQDQISSQKARMIHCILPLYQGRLSFSSPAQLLRPASARARYRRNSGLSKPDSACSAWPVSSSTKARLRSRPRTVTKVFFSLARSEPTDLPSS